MDNNSQLAEAIEIFVEKYWNNPKYVTLRVLDFEIENVYQVNIDVDSLKMVSTGLWTFNGYAKITIRDRSKIKMTKDSTIIGNARVKYNCNSVNQNEESPDVKQVTITKYIGLL